MVDHYEAWFGAGNRGDVDGCLGWADHLDSASDDDILREEHPLVLTYPSFVSSRTPVPPRHVHYVEREAPHRRTVLRKGRDVAEHHTRSRLEEDSPGHQSVLLRRIKSRPGITADEGTAPKPMPFATLDAFRNFAIAASFGEDLPAQKHVCQEIQGQ